MGERKIGTEIAGALALRSLTTGEFAANWDQKARALIAEADDLTAERDAAVAMLREAEKTSVKWHHEEGGGSWPYCVGCGNDQSQGASHPVWCWVPKARSILADAAQKRGT